MVSLRSPEHLGDSYTDTENEVYHDYWTESMIRLSYYSKNHTKKEIIAFAEEQDNNLSLVKQCLFSARGVIDTTDEEEYKTLLNIYIQGVLFGYRLGSGG